MGPSLGLWRAAEIAALREQTYEPPVLDLGCGDRAGPEPGGARALRPGGRLILTAPTEAFSRQLALSGSSSTIHP